LLTTFGLPRWCFESSEIEGLGKIFLEVEFSPPNLVRVSRGRLQYNGIEVEIRPDSLLIMNNRILLTNNVAVGPGTLLDIGDNPHPTRPTGIRIGVGPQQRHAFDRAAARRFRREHMH
jgi:hypothetical protein